MKDDQTPGANKVVFGLIAAGMIGFALYGAVTGDMSSRKTGELTRTGNPLFFWATIAMFAGIGVYAALVALGLVEMKVRSKADYAEHIKRDTEQKTAFLLLLASGGSAYAWWSERSLVNPSTMNEIMGWLALAFLGLAAWPPVLPPGPVRSAMRIAGTTAVLVAALAIFRLTR